MATMAGCRSRSSTEDVGAASPGCGGLLDGRAHDCEEPARVCSKVIVTMTGKSARRPCADGQQRFRQIGHGLDADQVGAGFASARI